MLYPQGPCPELYPQVFFILFHIYNEENSLFILLLDFSLLLLINDFVDDEFEILICMDKYYIFV